MTNDINELQEMFHNGSYANCDAALRTVAISMGYTRLRGVASTLRDYANRAHARLPGSIGVGVASRAQDPRQSRPGGKIDRRIDRWPSPLAITPQTIVPGFFVFLKPRRTESGNRRRILKWQT